MYLHEETSRVLWFCRPSHRSVLIKKAIILFRNRKSHLQNCNRLTTAGLSHKLGDLLRRTVSTKPSRFCCVMVETPTYIRPSPCPSCLIHADKIKQPVNRSFQGRKCFVWREESCASKLAFLNKRLLAFLACSFYGNTVPCSAPINGVCTN